MKCLTYRIQFTKMRMTNNQRVAFFETPRFSDRMRFIFCRKVPVIGDFYCIFVIYNVIFLYKFVVSISSLVILSHSEA